MNRLHAPALVLISLAFAACLTTTDTDPGTPGLDPLSGDGGGGCAVGAHCYANGSDGMCMPNGTCCTGCQDRGVCYAGTATGACGQDGAACVVCNDFNACTANSCESTGCVYQDYADGTVCAVFPTAVCNDGCCGGCGG